ncbi:MAG: hypothetical protein IAF02_13285 [Anaerolineae bacterium]|nr:hypothetical protein [Anaerolineae bacterium]
MNRVNDFVDFLVLAKQKTYAALGDEVTVSPLLPGSHQLEFAQAGWLYRDVYFGGDFFVGQETVYQKERPFWSMGYAGGLLDGVDASVDTVPLYDFLREALRHVGAERPFRGPHVYQKGEYAFSDIGDGHVGNFWGIETMSWREQLVYRLRYHGGFIR